MYRMEDMERFNILVSETNEAYHEVAVKFGFSDSVMQILYFICFSGGECRLSHIVKMSGIRKQTINSAMRKLEEDGIVITETATSRTKLVRFTEKGRSLANATAQKLINIENEIMEAWPEAERQSYFALTQKYLTDFKEKIGEL